MESSEGRSKSENNTEVRELDYKKLVKSVIEYARCWKPSKDILVPNDPKNGDFFIFHFDRSKGAYGRFTTIGPHCHAEEEAWKLTWKIIENDMLKKLES
jgi:hypothetical protein